MQYTGLKDKNDREIYEGDIIKCERDSWNEEKLRVVTWNESDAGFYRENVDNHVDSDVLADRKEGTSIFQVWQYQREVIGNIYENPKLLAS
jgi:uncharacterized phage protein (TIGR01671 family)